MTTAARRPRSTPGSVARSRGGRSRPALITTAIVLVLAAVHMFFTFVVNMPYPEVKYNVLPGRAADAYVRPFFVQNYRIFAPNPASEDRELWVRAWVESSPGQRTETEWVNATAVELASLERRVLRKQLSIVGVEQHMAAYRDLTQEQRDLVSTANFHRPGDLESLEESLGDDKAARDFLRTWDYLTAYATQVAEALHGDEGRILAVQVRAVYTPVPRWTDRNDPDAEAPTSFSTHSGWREPLVYAGQDSDEFARTFRAWFELAGEEALPR